LSYCVAHVGSSILVLWLVIIITSLAALAHWGAIPFPTPAGLWPGGCIPVELLNMRWGWWVVYGGGVGAAGFRWW
jgi:hypothetical protein